MCATWLHLRKRCYNSPKRPLLLFKEQFRTIRLKLISVLLDSLHFYDNRDFWSNKVWNESKPGPASPAWLNRCTDKNTNLVKGYGTHLIFYYWWHSDSGFSDIPKRDQNSFHNSIIKDSCKSLAKKNEEEVIRRKKKKKIEEIPGGETITAGWALVCFILCSKVAHSLFAETDKLCLLCWGLGRDSPCARLGSPSATSHFHSDEILLTVRWRTWDG